MPARWAGAAYSRWFSRHCVTAFLCQPCRLAYCGLRPRTMQGEVSPCEPLWPASQLLLASLALRASLRLLLPLVVALLKKPLTPTDRKVHPVPRSLPGIRPGMATGFFHRRAGPNGPGKTAAATPERLSWACYARKTENRKPKTLYG